MGWDRVSVWEDGIILKADDGDGAQNMNLLSATEWHTEKWLKWQIVRILSYIFKRCRDSKGRNKITIMQMFLLSINTALLKPALLTKHRLFCCLWFLNGDVSETISEIMYHFSEKE